MSKCQLVDSPFIIINIGDTKKQLYVNIESNSPHPRLNDTDSTMSVYLQWIVQRTADSFLPHSYWPRDSDDPSCGCIFYKCCRQKKKKDVTRTTLQLLQNTHTEHMLQKDTLSDISEVRKCVVGEFHTLTDLQWWALSGLMLQHFGHL